MAGRDEWGGSNEHFEEVDVYAVHENPDLFHHLPPERNTLPLRLLFSISMCSAHTVLKGSEAKKKKRECHGELERACKFLNFSF